MTARPDIIPIRDPGLGWFGVPPLFRLESPWYFELAMRWEGAPAAYMIPAGYEFDKASIPRLFWGPPLNYLPDGLCTTPALEHDFLCDLFNGGSVWLKEALGGKLPPCPPAAVIHEHFRRRLHQCGVRYAKAEAMGRAVAWFGPGGALRPSTLWRALTK